MSNKFADSQRGRPKDDSKRQAIVDAARKLFLAQAYDRVSVEAIAAEAGVSKVTVYSHFAGGKQEVFVAAMSAKAADIFSAAVLAAETGANLEETLANLARDFTLMVIDDEVGAMQMVLMAEGRRDPTLPQAFFDMVIRRWTVVLATLLARESQRGVIACADPDTAAQQFLAMAQGNFKYRQMMGLKRPEDSELEAYSLACAALFLRALRP
jgi:TetR/AcrR family transcriptional regulator, mexJK operon transcriptional repressor